ncbi:hypothetical protein ACA910_006992 [Epithemia clementina (nom. ined.)]
MMPQVQPYQLCSSEECRERERSNEISIWETSEPASLDGDHTNDGIHHQGVGTSVTPHQHHHDQQHISHQTTNKRGQNSNNKKKNDTIKWKVDPRRAVQKYRRAAAAGGVTTATTTTSTQPYRSPHDLNVTVDYLLCLLSQENGIGGERKGLASSEPSPSLRSLVEFVEDRIRAVQTDCVKWQGVTTGATTTSIKTASEVKASTTDRSVLDEASLSNNENTEDPMVLLLLKIQAKLVRAHILILHLMRHCKDYEITFGKRALTTAFAQYWSEFDKQQQREQQEQQQSRNQQPIHHQDLDDMLAYDTLFQLQKDLLLCERSDDGIGQAVLDPYRSILWTKMNATRTNINTNTQLQQQPISLFVPQFRWALQLAVDACLGHWYLLLERIAKLSSQPRLLSPRFQAMAKCLLLPALPRIRYKALQAYNVSWRKGEQLPGKELARLLHFSSSSSYCSRRALQFAQSYGLPVALTTDGGCEDNTNTGYVSLQSVPIQLFDQNDNNMNASSQHEMASTEATQQDDLFVFESVLSLPQLAIISATNNDDGHNSHNNSDRNKDVGWRVDGEGLRLPPIETMEKLLCLHS